MTRIILASASPRRRELLSQIGITPEIIPSGAEENITQEFPAETVTELSALKCRDVASRTEGDAIVIGADTIVTLDGEILGKPKDGEDAVRMLRELQGRTHAVYTGVTVIRLREGRPVREACFAEKTDVHVEAMTEQEISAYVHTGDPLDKAGAYGIQGVFARHISGVDGDYFNVVGLPLCRLWKILQEMSEPENM